LCINVKNCPSHLEKKLSTFSTVRRVSRDWGNNNLTEKARAESVCTAVEMKKRRKRSVDIPESLSAKSTQEDPLFTEEKIEFNDLAGVSS
jgi:hypothetical protein